jgi:hypothetical protein
VSKAIDWQHLAMHAVRLRLAAVCLVIGLLGGFLAEAAGGEVATTRPKPPIAHLCSVISATWIAKASRVPAYSVGPCQEDFSSADDRLDATWDTSDAQSVVAIVSLVYDEYEPRASTFIGNALDVNSAKRVTLKVHGKRYKALQLRAPDPHSISVLVNWTGPVWTKWKGYGGLHRWDVLVHVTSAKNAAAVLRLAAQVVGAHE